MAKPNKVFGSEKAMSFLICFDGRRAANVIASAHTRVESTRWLMQDHDQLIEHVCHDAVES